MATILYDIFDIDVLPKEVVNVNGDHVVEFKASIPPGLPQLTWNQMCTSYGKAWKTLQSFIPYAFSLSSSIINVIHRNTLPWQIAISPTGLHMAVMQTNILELRHSADDFSHVVTVWKPLRELDPMPQWRRMAWSVDGHLVAVSFSYGIISVLTRAGEWVCDLPVHGGTSNLSNISGLSSKKSVDLPPSALQVGDLVSGLRFIRCRPGTDSRWQAELLMICYNGTLRAFLIGDRDSAEPFALSHTFSFSSLHTVTCDFEYDVDRHLLTVGGSSICSGQREPVPNITIWRVLSSSPFYEHLSRESDSSSLDIPSKPSIISHTMMRLPWVSNKAITLLHVSLSPDNDKLATLDSDGHVYLFEVPSYRRLFTWESADIFSSINGVGNDEHDDEENSNHANREKDLVNVISWWSATALVCITRGGTTVIADIPSLSNLLGRSCEKFHPSSCVAFIKDRLIILECEKNILRFPLPCMSNISLVHAMDLVSHKKDEEKQFYNSDGDDNNSDLVEEDDGFLSKMQLVVRRAAYWGTGFASFAPTLGHVNLMVCEYRLVSLSSTTPLELFRRKIGHQEFGSALALAEHYKLNPDPIYQRQWVSSHVTEASIKNFLEKVKEVQWRLEQCRTVVADSVESTMLLYEYGLRCTDIFGPRLSNVTSNESISHEAENCNNNDEWGRQIVFSPQQRDAVMSFAKTLNEEERQICTYRLILFDYMDRLRTYSAIWKIEKPSESVNMLAFRTFRDVNLLTEASHMVRSGRFDAFYILMTRHASLLLPHWLPLMACALETTTPSAYSYLLPCSLKDTLNEDTHDDILKNCWNVEPWRRNLDWVEIKSILDVCKDGDTTTYTPARLLTHTELEIEFFEKAIYLFRPSYPSPSNNATSPRTPTRVQDFTADYGSSSLISRITTSRNFSGPVSVQKLSDWYVARAREIDAESGLVRNALALIEIGIERGVPNLGGIFSSLNTLTTILYDVGFESSDNLYTMSLSEFEILSYPKRLELLLSGCTIMNNDAVIADGDGDGADNFVDAVRKFAVPFLSTVNDKATALALLHDYMVTFATSDSRVALPYIARVLQHSKPTLRADKRIISDNKELLRTALDCMYACPRTDQLDTANDIFECLPLRQHDEDVDSIVLHDRVDAFDRQLAAAETLMHYGILVPLSYYSKCEEDEKAAHDLVQRLLRKAAGRVNPPLSDADWRSLLTNLVKLQSGVLSLASLDFCYSRFAENILGTGQKSVWILVSELMSGPSPRISTPSAENLILSAAREYIYSASRMNDPVLRIALDCLELIPGEPSSIIRSEMNLIAAVDSLRCLGITLLPMQIRLFGDYIEVIDHVLKVDETAYRSCAQLIELGSLFSISEEIICLRLVSAARLAQDSVYTADMCTRLINMRSTASWSVLCDVVNDTKLLVPVGRRTEFVAYAMSVCPADEISNLINFWNDLISQISGPVDDISQTREPRTISANQNYTRHPFHGTSEDDVIPYDQRHTTNLIHTFRAWATDELSRGFVSSVTFDDVKSEIVSIASDLLNMDILYGIALLLSISINDADAVLAKIQPTPFFLRFAVYYYSLRLCVLHTPVIQGSSSGPLNAIYRRTPEYLVHHVDSYSEMLRNAATNALSLTPVSMKMKKQRVKSDSGISTDSPKTMPLSMSRDTLTLLELRDHYKLLALDGAQLEALSGIDESVDVSKFLSDASYKCNVIIGLASTIHVDSLNLSLSLAERHGPAPIDIIIEHIVFIVSASVDNMLSSPSLGARFNDIILSYPILLANAGHVANEVCTRIWKSVPGSAHGVLAALITLLAECHRANSVDVPLEFLGLSYADHSILLTKIAASLPLLDYKALLVANCRDIKLAIITTALNESNVHVAAKMAMRIPVSNDKSVHLTATDIYQSFVLKQALSVNDGNLLVNVLDTCADYISRLKVGDIATLITEVALHPKWALSNSVSLSDRISWTERGIYIIRTRGSSSRKSNKKKGAGSFSENSEDLTSAEGVINTTMYCLKLSENPVMMELSLLRADLAANILSAFCDTARLRSIMIRIIVAGIPLRLCHQLLGVSRSVSAHDLRTSSLVATITEALSCMLLVDCSIDADVAQALSVESIESPALLLQQVIASLNCDGLDYAVDCVELRMLLFEKCEIEASGFVKGKCAILEALLSASNNDTNNNTKSLALLNYYKTLSLIDADSVTLSPNDVDSIDACKKLFMSILKPSRRLGELLCVWQSAFNDSNFSSQWLSLIDVLLASGDINSILILTKTQYRLQLSDDGWRHVYDMLDGDAALIFALRTGKFNLVLADMKAATSAALPVTQMSELRHVLADLIVELDLVSVLAGYPLAVDAVNVHLSVKNDIMKSLRLVASLVAANDNTRVAWHFGAAIAARIIGVPAMVMTRASAQGILLSFFRLARMQLHNSSNAEEQPIFENIELCNMIMDRLSK